VDGNVVLRKIQELSEERERLVHEESRHGLAPEGHERLRQLELRLTRIITTATTDIPMKATFQAAKGPS
jgi:hypothetical protein